MKKIVNKYFIILIIHFKYLCKKNLNIINNINLINFFIIYLYKYIHL